MWVLKGSHFKMDCKNNTQLLNSSKNCKRYQNSEIEVVYVGRVCGMFYYITNMPSFQKRIIIIDRCAFHFMCDIHIYGNTK